MTDYLNDDLNESRFDELYTSFLYKLLLHLQSSSLPNETDFYASLVEIAKAKPTPHLIDQKINRLRALKKDNKAEWLNLKDEVAEFSDNKKLVELFQKAFEEHLKRTQG
jgi:hypothetical protein